MDLSTILLIVAIVSGLAGGMSARFRSWGTGAGDLLVGGLIGGLIGLLAVVVLALTHGLDGFGVLHMAYLLAVVSAPIAFIVISLPLIIDQEFSTPIVAWLLFFAALGLIGIGIWATHIEPDRLEVDRQGLGASGAERPIVVGVISDLQTPSVGEHERRAVDEILAADPDLVVMPGDLYQLDDDEVGDRGPEFIGLLRRLTDSVELVVLVGGDTDDPEILAEIAAESGAVLLQDDILDVELDGQRMSIVGLRNPFGDDRSTIDPLVRDLLVNSYDEDDLIVLLSHPPDPVLELGDLPIDLMIAGHTHGGQVSLPGIGPLLTASDVPRRVAAGGLHLVDGHPIYVSTGVGIERGQAPQIRFGVRPSVAVITIVPN